MGHGGAPARTARIQPRRPPGGNGTGRRRSPRIATCCDPCMEKRRCRCTRANMNTAASRRSASRLPVNSLSSGRRNNTRCHTVASSSVSRPGFSTGAARRCRLSHGSTLPSSAAPSGLAPPPPPLIIFQVDIYRAALCLSSICSFLIVLHHQWICVHKAINSWHENLILEIKYYMPFECVCKLCCCWLLIWCIVELVIVSFTPGCVHSQALHHVV